MTQTDRLTLLHHCSVVDGVNDEATPDAGRPHPGERIVAVGAEADLRVQAQELEQSAGDAIVEVDLDGAWLMAGLLNMHTHFSLSLPGPGGAEVQQMGPAELTLYMAHGARRTLNSGVTSVRCVAEKDHVEFALRAGHRLRAAAGPRIFTAGRALVCTGGHGHEGTDTLECDGADGFRRGARAQISQAPTSSR